MKIKGVISDMDGVILDTEKLYVKFWCKAANLCGYPMQKQHALSIRSMARPLTVKKLKGYFGDDFDYTLVHDLRISLMTEYINKNGVEAKKGAKELLEYLKNNNYKVALATATALPLTQKYLQSLNLYNYFDEIVCASMVKNGKPFPDIYIKASQLLGLDAQDCLALEDSQNGIKSAYSAKCKTVMVPDLDQPTNQVKPMLFDVATDLYDVIKILEKNNT